MAAASARAAADDPRRQRGRCRRREGGRGRRRPSSTASRSTRPAWRRSPAAVEGVAALPDPVGRVLATFERPNGLMIERVATPLGVIGVIFESRPNVDRRRRRALPQGRQRRDPARRLGQLPHPRAAIAAAMVEGLAAAGLPADAIQLVPTARPRRGRRDARRARRHARRHRAARRQEPRRARAGGGARAGVRASRRHLPRLRPSRRADLDMAQRHRRSTPRCAAPASAAPPRRCWSTAPAPATHLAPLVDDAARRRLRGARRRRRAGRRSARHAGQRGGLAHRISRRRSSRSRVVDGLDAAIDHIETLRLAPHRRDRHRGRGGGRALPRRGRFGASCCTTPRPSSPTAASSASAPRSASPPAACTRAARSGVEQLTSFKYRVRGAGQTRPVSGGRSAARACRRMPRRACASASTAARSTRRTPGTAMSACLALKRLRLDRVWWLVTPGNPLKERGGLAAARPSASAAARALARHPRIAVTGFEARSARATPSTRSRYLAARCAGRAVRLDHGRRQPGAASTAGAAGGGSPRLMPLRGHRPPGLDPARRPVAAPPLALAPLPASTRPTRRCSPSGRRRPGSSCTGPAPPCRRPRCGTQRRANFDRMRRH